MVAINGIQQLGGNVATPVTNDAAYDLSPIAGLKIAAPAAASTRNFVSGLWILTNGSAIDKGRGILLQNLGASDGMCILQDGVDGTGEAILLTASATNAVGAVIGTTLASQIGLEVRQETSVSPTAASDSLLVLLANGAVTEMGRIGSTVAAQIGFVFRMWGAGSYPVIVKDASQITVASVAGDGAIAGKSFTMNTKPNVTGSRAANAALASLLTALAAIGLITDGTS